MIKLSENAQKDFDKMIKNGGFQYAYHLLNRSLEIKDLEISKRFYQQLNGMMIYQMWEDKISPASYTEITAELSFLVYGI